MGADFSLDAASNKGKSKNVPPKVVLVPPMFERDLKARSRFTKSSYDYLFAKNQLKWLFNDYLSADGVQGALFFSPPADERFNVKASLAMHKSSMTLRYQPLGLAHPNTFIDVRANPHRAGDVSLRACFLDPASGLGVFTTAPLAKRISNAMAQVGVRYSSPGFTAGLIVAPRNASLTEVWLGGRYEGLTFGCQLRPGPEPLKGLLSTSSTTSPDDVMEWLRQRTCFAVAYTPPAAVIGTRAGKGSFTASVEMRQGTSLLVSFFQHFAVSRRVINPIEKDNVVGITNYIDIGLQLVTPLVNVEDAPGAAAGGASAPESGANTSRGKSSGAASSGSGAAPAAGPLPAPRSGVAMAASWQVNKNWMVKARVGSEDAAAALALRSWFNPSLLLAACVQFDYRSGMAKGASWQDGVRWGLRLQLENFGPVRYERGTQELRGGALIQRHEATLTDIANFEGSGMTVGQDAEASQYNPPVKDVTASYL